MATVIDALPASRNTRTSKDLNGMALDNFISRVYGLLQSLCNVNRLEDRGDEFKYGLDKALETGQTDQEVRHLSRETHNDAHIMEKCYMLVLESLLREYPTEFELTSSKQARSLSEEILMALKIPPHFGTKANFKRMTRDGPALLTDNGYGSRIDAANNLAGHALAENSLFGMYGPGRRKRKQEVVDGDYFVEDGGDSGREEKRSRNFILDHGYGSRLQAGSYMAKDIVTRNIFGSFGPGRR